MDNSTGAFTGGNFERLALFVYSGILGAIALAIVLGNMFTIVAFSTKRNGSKHAHILLINLAVADILVGAISIPILIYLIGSENKWWARAPRIIDSIYEFNDVLAGFASIFSLVCITLERLYATLFPLQHRLKTKRIYYSSLIMIWLTSVLITTIHNFLDFSTLDYIVTIIFGLSLLLIFMANIKLWFTVKTHKVSSARRQMEVIRERKLAKTLSLVTAVFILTWLPFHVVLAIRPCAPRCNRLQMVVLITTKILHYGNSMANPILYAFRIKEFRDCLREMLSCKRNKPKPRVTNSTSRKTRENNTSFEMDTKL